MADESGREVSVWQFPPGTSRWIKIGHRMFRQTARNWRGRPLVSREEAVNLIGSLRTNCGLTIRSELDENSYATGRKVTPPRIKSLSLQRDNGHQRG